MCSIVIFSKKTVSTCLCQKQLVYLQQNEYDMKEGVYILLIVILAGCSASTREKMTEQDSVIERMYRDAASDSLSYEEEAKWDSLNNKGEYLLVRGAERNLDTIVNHMHFIFTTEK